MTSIYFDNNATTHLDSVVAQRMHELNLEGVSNPASQHQPGRRALHLLEEAKSQILVSVDAPNDGMDAARVILTSGGTEANNLAIFGYFSKRPGVGIVGATDHPSVIEAAHAAATNQPSCSVRVLPVNADGICDLERLSTWVDEIHASDGQQVSFVSVMLGNNETGIIQDLKSICDICSKYGIPVHSDIVQAVGKIPVNMQSVGLSALTLTGHKIHGPVGIGALIVAANSELAPMIVGGGQQLGARAGTEPVVPAVALALSLERICEALEAGEYDRVRKLRDRFEYQISSLAEISLVGIDSPRLPHTSNLSFHGFDRQALHMALDLNGLACSTGSACSSGSGRPSGSLVAMGLPDEVVRGSLRFSFSRYSTEDEVDRAISIVAQALAKSHSC